MMQWLDPRADPREGRVQKVFSFTNHAAFYFPSPSIPLSPKDDTVVYKGLVLGILRSKSTGLSHSGFPVLPSMITIYTLLCHKPLPTRTSDHKLVSLNTSNCTMIENNLQFEMQSMASCPPRFLSVKRARNLSVNGLRET